MKNYGLIFEHTFRKSAKLETFSPKSGFLLPQRKDTILVASKDPYLADVRKQVLETAGFRVIPAADTVTIREVCRKKKVSLVMIGYSLPPSEKRRVTREARESCRTPILQLYRGEEPELIDRHHFAHLSRRPEDFLPTVQRIVGIMRQAD